MMKKQRRCFVNHLSAFAGAVPRARGARDRANPQSTSLSTTIAADHLLNLSSFM
jgi:hypothetical protein